MKAFTNSLLSLMLAAIVFSSCSVFKSSNAREVLIVHDTIRLVYDTAKNELLDGDAVAGLQRTKQVTFYGPGDTTTFRQGEKIELISDGIDFSKYTYSVETNEETDEVTIRVVEIDDHVITFTEKCQCFDVMEPYVLPTVKVSPDLKLEQVIFTPLFDSKCNHIGYQVRYGSTERGCKREARDALKSFRNCTKKHAHEKKKKKKIKRTPCSLCILGLHCPEHSK